MILSLLTVDDVQQIAFIEQQCFGADAWNINMLKGEFEGGSVFFGIKQEDTVVAYICARYIIDEADINNIAVLPQYRKQGFAQKLINALMLDSQNKNIFKLTLEVNANNIPAKNLYKKMGFKTLGVRKGYYHGEDAEIMWWNKENV